MKISKFCSCFNSLFLIVDFVVKETLTGNCHCMHVSEWVLIACAIAWSCGVERFEEIPVLRARFLAKFRWRRFWKVTWTAKATPGVFKFSYLRNYCLYFLILFSPRIGNRLQSEHSIFNHCFQSKKISNDQELIQSDPTSCPQKGNN